MANKAIPMKNQMLVFKQLTDTNALKVISDSYYCDLAGEEFHSDAGESLESFRERVRTLAIERRIKILGELCIMGEDVLC